MSSDAALWAKRSKGHRSRDDKLVLMVMADSADPKRFLCWPTRAVLGDLCEMDQATLARCLASLEKGGFITRLSNPTDDGRTMYRLNVTNQVQPTNRGEGETTPDGR